MDFGLPHMRIIHLCTIIRLFVCLCIYIYMHIGRETERMRERERKHVCLKIGSSLGPLTGLRERLVLQSRQ